MFKRILTYGLIVFLAVCCLAQPASWNFYPGTKGKAEFNISPDFLTINYNEKNVPQAGDAVGVFVMNDSGKYVCIGYSKITSPDSQIIVNAYANDGVSGFRHGQTYRLMYWKASRSCQLIINSNTRDSLYVNKIIKTDSASAVTLSPQYVKPEYKKGDTTGLQRPVNTNGAFIVYYASSPGLAINKETGVIDVNSSSPGQYSINLSSEYCLTQDTIKVTILDADSTTDTIPRVIAKDTLNLSNMNWHLTDATCTQQGRFHVEDMTVKGTRPLTYSLTRSGMSHTNINTNGAFENLAPGFYRLAVKDSAGKEKIHPETFVIKSAEDCQSFLLKPGEEKLFIPDAGSAKIIDRDGILIKTITVPGEWDCRNSMGQPVPMGDYYLFINEVQNKVITVLR